MTPVTKANYAAAETEVILADSVRKIARGTCSDGMGVFFHKKTAQDRKERSIVRPYFDTLYSCAVLDLDHPATVVFPDTDRYQILTQAVAVQDQIKLEQSAKSTFVSA